MLTNALFHLSVHSHIQQSHHHVRLKRENVYSLEPRRSSRARNPVPSYRDDVSVMNYDLQLCVIVRMHQSNFARKYRVLTLQIYSSASEITHFQVDLLLFKLYIT